MSYHQLHARPELREPVLVMVLDGWIDAGLGAAAALAALLGGLPTELVATFDTDVLLDHRSRRPIVRIEEGVNTGLTWPTLQLRAAPPNALVLAGPEPDHLWRSFCEDVVGLARSFAVRLVVGLGAFPAPVPHTRAVRLASTATMRDLAETVGYVGGTLDVPAGVQAALERAFADAGVPAVGLWARVPHYAAAMPYPAASAALLDGLASLTGIRVETADLHRAAGDSRARLDELVANNPEHVELVRQLEAQVDTEIPSGDELAAELERFLREDPPTA